MNNLFSQFKNLNMLSKHNLDSLVDFFTGGYYEQTRGMSPENPITPVFSNSSACVWKMDREA